MTSPAKQIEEAIEGIRWLWDVDCEGDPDEDSIGWSGDGEMPVTFGDIRNVKTALTHIRALQEIDVEALREAVERFESFGTSSPTDRVLLNGNKTLLNFLTEDKA